jgi:hypothetical protein
VRPRIAATAAAVLVVSLAAAQPALPAAGHGARVHRKASTCKLVSAPPKVVDMGKAFALTGKLKPKAARAVKAQLRVGKRWRVVSSKRSAKRTGAFRLKVQSAGAAGPMTLRAYAPRTSRFAAAACRSVKVTVMAPDGSMGPASNPMPQPMSGPTAPDPPPSKGPGPANSFRAVYALASGQVATAGEIPAIVNDINVVNGWYATQTNNSVQPRWVRDKKPDGSLGDPTVITVTLSHPASAYTGADGINTLVDDVNAAAPPASPSEKTVVWIDAGDYACGQTGRGVSVVWEPACGIYPATSDAWPFGGSYLVAHEMTHNFGAVPSCAPHYDGTDHANDDTRDVLYQGPLARDWSDQELDPGHDDYYDTGRSDCVGIEASPFWTATADIGS